MSVPRFPAQDAAAALELELLRGGARHARACATVLLLGLGSLAAIGASQGQWGGALALGLAGVALAVWRLRLAARLAGPTIATAEDLERGEALQRPMALHFATCGLVYAAVLVAWYPSFEPGPRALMAFVTGTALAGSAQSIVMVRHGLVAFLTPPLVALAGVWIHSGDLAVPTFLQVAACVATMTTSILFGAWLHRMALRDAIEARNAARDSGMAKARFLATMSHEIRTPMQGILGSLEQLERSPLPTGQQQWLATALGSGRALLEVLNQVLERSRLDAGPLRLVMSPFDLKLTVQSAVDLFRAKAAQLGLALEFSAEPAVEGLWLGDAARLQQVVMNLIGNSLKFTTRGLVGVRLRRLPVRSGHGLVAEQHWLVIDVTDTGRGMPAPALARIFEPFYQIPGDRSEATAGSGLGLSISHGLVSQMGGTITVHSELHAGSTFSVRVPLRRAFPVPQPSGRRADITDDAHGAALQGLTVLVAEDDPVLAMVCAAMLKQHGATVFEAADGRQALEIACARCVDLVLLDVQMPRLDGREVTRRLRAWEAAHHRPPVPVIAMSANSEVEDMRACREAGMNDHVAKPFGQRALIAVLARWRGVDQPLPS